MIDLGKIEHITDLRTVWQHEAQDFSKWLAEEENLTLLSDTIGIDIVLNELESSVGGFSVDIFAEEESTGRKIIIENQLEDTNHDHLGKILTYASGKNAEVIIWIVKRARDEHKQAIEWLNQHTDENIGFFLLEIELWKINDSIPAPKFNLVERPNDWTKALKFKEGLSDTNKIRLEFWQCFNEYAFSKNEFSKEFKQRKAQAHNWYDLSVGSSEYHIGLTMSTQKQQISASIYFKNNKDLFEKFKSFKDEIENQLNVNLEWRTANKVCKILTFYNGSILDSNEQWHSYFDWYCDLAIKFKQVIKKYDI